MKKFLIILLVVNGLSISSKTHSNYIRPKEKLYVDSLFKSYFYQLEFQLQKNELNGHDLNLRVYIINNLEKLTGLKSEVPKSHFSIFKFTRKDLDSWINWYNTNKKKLRINLKTNEIYLNKKLLFKIQKFED